MASLTELLAPEEGAFRQIDFNWKPQDLLPNTQTKNMLSDITHKLGIVQSTLESLKKLPKADELLQLVRQMGWVQKRASFARRSNDLLFLQSVSEFYGAYGELLRRVKTAQFLAQSP